MATSSLNTVLDAEFDIEKDEHEFRNRPTYLLQMHEVTVAPTIACIFLILSTGCLSEVSYR
jgi:hypothetical protein